MRNQGYLDMKRKDSSRSGPQQGSGWLSNPTRVLTGALLVLLLIQFLTGTWLNLFVALPGTPSSSLSGALGAMMSGPMPAVHLAVGVILSVLSIVVLAILFDSGQSSPAKFAAVGLVSILLAGTSGTAFASSGFQNSVDSYLMAVAFISAFISYFAVILTIGGK